MPSKTEKDRVEAEKSRLSGLFTDLPDDERAIAQGLIERAAWMRIQCEILEADIEKHGWTQPFQKDSKTKPYDRARPQATLYQTMNANYQRIMRQLNSLLGIDGNASDGDGFDSFVNGRDDD